MKIAIKFLAVALLSLTVGIACATPLLIEQLNIKPFPGLPQGPKADTSISVVYANFTVSPGRTINGVSFSILDYEVVLNVTNHSDLGNAINRLGITAAQDINTSPGIIGMYEYCAEIHSSRYGDRIGTTFTDATDGVVNGIWGYWGEYRNGQTLSGGNGLVTGVWLDGDWVNVTWIPGTHYPGWPTPSGWTPLMSLNWSRTETWPTTTTIPPLPENTTGGTWIEGIPILEMRNITSASGKTLNVETSTAIFVNGAWVDVTGRVQPAQEQLYIRAFNTVASEKHYFGPELPRSLRNYWNTTQNSTLSQNNLPFKTYTKSGEGEFNNYWAPNESRLILLKGTREVKSDDKGIATLSTGKIMLIAQQFNEVHDPSVNSTAVRTASNSHWLNEIQLQQTTNGYLYNTIGDRIMVTDKWGIEVFLRPRS